MEAAGGVVARAQLLQARGVLLREEARGARDQVRRALDQCRSGAGALGRFLGVGMSRHVRQFLEHLRIFAYARLAQDEDPRVFGPEVFSELAGRFTQFADLLSEISEQSQLATNQSVLRLYERWIQTGSRRVAALLAERGITPVLPGENRPQ